LEKIPSPSKIISQLVEKPVWLTDAPYIFAQFVYNEPISMANKAFYMGDLFVVATDIVGTETPGPMAATCRPPHTSCFG
jgi:hypothetical protein